MYGSENKQTFPYGAVTVSLPDGNTCLFVRKEVEFYICLNNAD